MKTKQRIHEIDLVRGIGVILMILFHFIFDLSFFGIINFRPDQLPWNLIARTAQIIFIVCAGITFTFSTEKSQDLKISKIFQGKLKYLITLSSLALLITLITWLIFRNQFVIFGILHFYVIATLLTIPLRKLKIWNALLGILILVISFVIPKFDALWWTYPLGLNNPTFLAFDYFPLLPWYGVFLIGVAIGSFLINKNILQTYQPVFQNMPLETIGKHSLLIYLFHQPIIAGLLILIISYY
jgi:uncharacterized membrane protein